MSDWAVCAEGLSKRYRLGEREQYGALRDVITGWVKAPARLLRGAGRPPSSLWALQDVSFEIGQGEAIGIIGRNGAGKSTLLKILSRITKPTQGQARIRGRVGSLLEVGTGFHPELTGRENIYFNGAVLGMRRAEIERKFDEIVDFSEIETFIDTPVKRYSSGMHMRLAFAVAAHLEPEILMIDEVLAVGDAAFQKKCLGRMGSAAGSGRTIIFVSHNMAAVQDLCSRVLWMDGGRVAADGPAAETISRYLQTSYSSQTESVWSDPAQAPGDAEARLLALRVRPREGRPYEPITVNTPFVVEFELWRARPDLYLHPTFYLHNEQGTLVCSTGAPYLPDWRERRFPAGHSTLRCHIPGDLLNNGMHRISIALDKNGETILRLPDALTFDVQDSPIGRDGWYGDWPGVIRPQFHWETVSG